MQRGLREIISKDKYYRFAYEVSTPNEIAMHEEFFCIPKTMDRDGVDKFCQTHCFSWLEEKYGSGVSEYINVYSSCQEVSKTIFESHVGLYYDITTA